METPCLCSFQGWKYGRRKPTETSVVEFSSDKEFLDSKISQNRPHESFPGRQLSAVMQTPGNSSVLYRKIKRRTLSNRKFVCTKV